MIHKHMPRGSENGPQPQTQELRARGDPEVFTGPVGLCKVRVCTGLTERKGEEILGAI